MKIMAMTLCWLVATSCFGQDESIYQGIWQDVKKPDRYFTIHANDKTLVLVYLEGIPKNENTLQSAYIGKVFARTQSGVMFVLKRISPAEVPDAYDQIELSFTSPTEGTIYPHTVQHLPNVLFIRRIF